MNQPRVLVIDDNSVSRKLVRFTLEKDGIEVLEASSRADALQRVAQLTPDLVLLDLVLPDGNGFELLPALRQQLGERVPILAFTGLLSSLDENRLGKAGFDDVVSKPAEPSRLRDVLRAYLPMRQNGNQDSFGGGRKLLVVDDDVAQRKLTAFQLSRLDFHVVTAGDGVEGVNAALRERPAAIVCDLLMPRADGFELCSTLRAHPDFRQVPIILATNSYLDEGDRDLATRVGADAYVIRSFDLRELVAALRSSLASPNVRQLSPAEEDLPREAQSERAARTLRQLERQVAQNASLSQRCAMLSAELTILGGLTSALVEHRDVDTALEDALGACFDAGGIAWGLLLVRENTTWSCKGIGLPNETLERVRRWPRAIAKRIAQHQDASKGSFTLPIRELFEDGDGDGKALVTPIVHRGENLGAVILSIGQALDDHHVTFASVVAGQIAFVLALARSFGELERASAEQRTRAQVLSSVLDAIGDPVLVLDAHGTPSHANRAAENLQLFRAHGTNDDTHRLGIFRADMATPYHHDTLPTSRALRGEIVEDEELVTHPREGDAIWTRVTARPIRNHDRIEGAVAVLRDVTQEKRDQARQIASDRLASIGTMAAGVAHEINNPLTALLVELDMALDEKLTPEVAEHVRNARDAADRVRIIVRDLRTLSRDESDTVAPVDIHRALDSAIRLAMPQLRARAELRCDWSDVPPVLGNESRFVQVFLNLLVNAAHALPPQPSKPHEVRVRTFVDDAARAVIEISDTGTGMPPEVRARLFTPFFTTKEVGRGTGLGLSISHRIITGVGGTIDCDTQLGEGTTFRVTLPLAPRGSTTQQTPASMTNLQVRLRILAVQSSLLDFQQTSRSLRPAHDLVRASNADAALQILNEDKTFDVILCDADTVRGACREFLRRIERAHPEFVARVAFVVRNDDQSDVPGEPAPLRKPFSGVHLQRFLQAHISHLARGGSNP